MHVSFVELNLFQQCLCYKKGNYEDQARALRKEMGQHEIRIGCVIAPVRPVIEFCHVFPR